MLSDKLPETEQSLLASQGLESMSIAAIIGLIVAEEKNSLQTILQAKNQIETVVEETVKRFCLGGRLFYVGAGTSGRLGVLDASECPPTFSVPPDMVQGIIAGGDQALRQAVEGAEDSEETGMQQIQKKNISSDDVVIGIAASGKTPFVHGALKEAHLRKAYTAFVTCASNAKGLKYINTVVEIIVGAEIISGSTRLKAGSATKTVLNMISTISMIRLGKVYDNLMVDLCACNNKLKDRAIRIFMTIEKKEHQIAKHFLTKANWEVKTAIVMSRKGLGYKAARKLLLKTDGFLHLALQRGL